MKTAASILLGLILIAAVDAGGDGKPKDLIVGKWSEKEAGTFTLEFTKDGQLSVSVGDKLLKGTYKFVDEKTLEVEINDKNEKNRLTVEKISKQELTLSKDGANKKEFTRVK